MGQETDNNEGIDPSFSSRAPAAQGVDNSDAAANEAAIAAAIEAAEHFDLHEMDPGSIRDNKLDLVCASYVHNDLGNANRLRARFGRDLVFVPELGWLAWTGKYWSRKEGDSMAFRFAHKTAMAIFEEATAIEKKGPKGYDDPKDWEERIEKKNKWAVASGNAGKLAAMLNEAAPYLTKRVEDLDRNPFLFNCQNGTINLQDIGGGDGEQRRPVGRHHRGDLITKISPCSYNQEKSCSTFRGFMDSIQRDQDIQLFLQRYFGYSLSGDTSEQCLVLFHGTGSNGKSTLMDVINYILGDYALNLPFSSLLYDERKRGSEASPDIARLPGARMVFASEPEVGARFSESLIKTLTGSEKITARDLNKPFFEFYPQFKLALAFNNKPSVRGQDEGIWRRLHMVPFDTVITGDKKDRTLPAKLRAEADGILCWLVDGAALWLEKGLQVPDIIKDATRQYRRENDKVGEFLDSATVVAEGAYTKAKDLFNAYKKWCVETANDPMAQSGFGRRLSDRGIKKSKVGNIFYEGIELKPEYLAGHREAEGDNYGGVP